MKLLERVRDIIMSPKRKAQLEYTWCIEHRNDPAYSETLPDRLAVAMTTLNITPEQLERDMAATEALPVSRRKLHHLAFDRNNTPRTGPAALNDCMLIWDLAVAPNNPTAPMQTSPQWPREILDHEYVCYDGQSPAQLSELVEILRAYFGVDGVTDSAETRTKMLRNMGFPEKTQQGQAGFVGEISTPYIPMLIAADILAKNRKRWHILAAIAGSKLDTKNPGKVNIEQVQEYLQKRFQ